MVLAARARRRSPRPWRLAEDQRRGAHVHVLAARKASTSSGSPDEVGEDAKLDLRVVGADDDVTRRRDEGRADRPAELGADGDVLEVRVARREAPGGGDGLVEARVDAPRLGVDVPRERVDVRALELVDLAVLEDRLGSGCLSASASSTSASVERPPLGVRLTTGSFRSSKRIFSSWSRDRSTKSCPAMRLHFGAPRGSG